MSHLRKKNKSDTSDLDALVLSGPQGAYEALQLYRSKSMRFKSKDNLAEAIHTAANGAKVLLSNNYVNAGAELASMTIEFISDTNNDITSAHRNLLFDIDSAFPSNNPLRIEFLKSVIKVSVANGIRELGDPALHLRLATSLWEIGDKSAVYHFVVSEDPEQLAFKIDTSYGNQENIALRDQTITMGILHFVAMENLRDANELFRLVKKSQKLKELPFDSALITFNDYLLQVCRRDATPLFKTLVNAYATHLNFDATAGTLLMGPIAQRLFNIQPKANPMLSMLQNLLK